MRSSTSSRGKSSRRASRSRSAARSRKRRWIRPSSGAKSPRGASHSRSLAAYRMRRRGRRCTDTSSALSRRFAPGAASATHCSSACRSCRSSPPLRHRRDAATSTKTRTGAAPRRRRARDDHRRHPLDRPIAARLRSVRRDDRGLRRHLRHAGELPHHARGARRGVRALGRYVHADELLERPLHAGDRGDGGARAARHAAQRLDVRHPLPRHQHVAHVRRPALQPHAQRLVPASSSTPARTTTSPPPTRSSKRHTVLASPVHQRSVRARRRHARQSRSAWATRTRSTPSSRTASCSSSRRRSWRARSSRSARSSTCRRPST